MGCGACQSPRGVACALKIFRGASDPLSEAPQSFNSLSLIFPAAICLAVCAHVPPPVCPMHKKRAHCLFHALTGSPCRGLKEYMKQETRPVGAYPATIRSFSEKPASISSERHVCCTQTLGLADFSPPRQSFTDSASAYLRKTPRIIPQSTHICLRFFQKLFWCHKRLAGGASPLILANVHPMDAQSSFGWTRGCPSDRRSDVHQMDTLMSIG